LSNDAETNLLEIPVKQFQPTILIVASTILSAFGSSDEGAGASGNELLMVNTLTTQANLNNTWTRRKPVKCG